MAEFISTNSFNSKKLDAEPCCDESTAEVQQKNPDA